MAVNRIWMFPAPDGELSVADLSGFLVGYPLSGDDYSLISVPASSYSAVSVSENSYSLSAKPTISAQDGAYAGIVDEDDGAYAEDGPSKFGQPYGVWADSGDGWAPLFPSPVVDYTLTAKPTDTYTLITPEE